MHSSVMFFCILYRFRRPANDDIPRLDASISLMHSMEYVGGSARENPLFHMAIDVLLIVGSGHPGNGDEPFKPHSGDPAGLGHSGTGLVGGIEFSSGKPISSSPMTRCGGARRQRRGPGRSAGSPRWTGSDGRAQSPRPAHGGQRPSRAIMWLTWSGSFTRPAATAGRSTPSPATVSRSIRRSR